MVGCGDEATPGESMWKESFGTSALFQFIQLIKERGNLHIRGQDPDKKKKKSIFYRAEGILNGW